MHFLPSERIAVFIDGANLDRLPATLGSMSIIPTVGFLPETGTCRAGVRRFGGAGNRRIFAVEAADRLAGLQWLQSRHQAGQRYTDATGRRRVKGNMDIEIAVDMLELVGNGSRIYHVVLFSGDADFARWWSNTAKGCRVTVISSIKTSPPMIGDELRRQADHFIDLNDIGGLHSCAERAT